MRLIAKVAKRKTNQACFHDLQTLDFLQIHESICVFLCMPIPYPCMHDMQAEEKLGEGRRLAGEMARKWKGGNEGNVTGPP